MMIPELSLRRLEIDMPLIPDYIGIVLCIGEQEWFDC